MKKVIVIAFFIPSLLSAQLSENFETGSVAGWLQYPVNRWAAESVAPLAGVYSLHHNYDNLDVGTDCIGLPVNHMHPDEGTSQWSFLIKHGYAPSSTNNWAVFLMSDVEPGIMSFGSGTNGFIVGVNITGSDDLLKLVKIKNGAITTIINSGINWETQVGSVQYAAVSVGRLAAGNWTLSVVKQDGTAFGTSTGTDAELFNHDYFGIIYRYTATKDLLLWIDDITINGIFYSDEEAPFITAKSLTGRNSVSLSFNEKIPDTYLEPSNFIMNSAPAISLEKTGSETISLTFGNDLVNKKANALLVKRICDVSGNCSENIIAEFNPVWAETGDVIISELMADPSPAVSLPDAEYIEVTNRTAYSFSMNKWQLFAGENGYLLPDKTIRPGEIIILCSQKDTSTFSVYGKTSGLKSFPSVLNEGMMLRIVDSTGMLIHGIAYEQNWYADMLKATGGWSLEMKDKNFPFSGKGNWKASFSRTGGTPGAANSVSGYNPDSEFQGLVNVFAIDNRNVTIEFSEPILNQADILANATINEQKIKSIRQTDPLCRSFMAETGFNLEKGVTYDLVIPGDLSDFAGNHLKTCEKTFGLTEPASSGDIIFNELLFNPAPGYPDYIELYNCSGKSIDASRLFVVSVNDDSSDTSVMYQVSSVQRCIMPGTYYVITTDRERVLEKYFTSEPSLIFNVNELPSMPDDKGHLLLLNRELDPLDEVHYNEKMHNCLNNDYEGVALERLSANKWHSATERSGCGTPGKKNSEEDSDTTAPSVTRHSIICRNAVSVTFNEQVTDESLLTNNFSQNSFPASAVSKTANTTVLVTLQNNLENKSTNILVINRLCDFSGNCSENITLEFNPVWAETGDVIISELMADPSPAVSLPDVEYVELTNRTAYAFSMNKWKLCAGEDSYLLPDKILNPGEIVILCAQDDTSAFSGYGKTVGLRTFPTLQNEGNVLFVTDSTGLLIHGTAYSDNWYDDALKASGGWSMEMIDKDFPFSGKENWKTSVSRKGGTPGTANSVSGYNPDSEFLGLVNVFAVDNRNVTIEFSEPVLNQVDILANATINGQKIKSIRQTDPLCRSFVAETGFDLEKGVSYDLVVLGELSDFAGNHLKTCEKTFAVTEPASSGDIVFNELLFNPEPGFPDYIELYNCSAKSIDASRLFVVSINDETSDTSVMYQVSPVHRCIMPGSYYVITTDRERVLEKYITSEPSLIFDVNELPSMPDDKGHLLLLNRELDPLDEIYYNEKMHYSLIDDYEGKALERLSDEKWHTASESSGWGTPGLKNSAFIDPSGENVPVALSSTKITPDGDGFEDDLQIRLKFQDSDNVISVTIFSEAGILVRKLVSNLLAGPEALITWDGTRADGSPVQTGIYIIFITYYNDKGDTGKWKKVCAVIRD